MDPIQNAIGILQHNCLHLNPEKSPQVMIEAIQLLCNNAVDSTLHYTNKLIESDTKYISVHFPNSHAELSVCDLRKFKILLYRGLTKYISLNKWETFKVESIVRNAINLLNIHLPDSYFLLEFTRSVITSQESDVTPKCLTDVLMKAALMVNCPQGCRKNIESLIKAGTPLLPYQARVIILNALVANLQISTEVPCFLVAEIINTLNIIDILPHVEMLINFVFNGFSSNVDSAQRSHIYCSLIQKLSFEQFETFVWQKCLMKHYKNGITDNFVESLNKYFVPMTIQKHGIQFYEMLRKQAFHLNVTSYTLLCSVKRSLCKPLSYREDVQIFMACSTPETALFALETVCIFKSKSYLISDVHLNIIIDFLEESNAWKENVNSSLKALKAFTSHLIVTVNGFLNKNCDIEFHWIVRFVRFMYEFCVGQMSIDCHVNSTFGFKLYAQTCELFALDSSKLAVEYNLAKSDQYRTGENQMYSRLLQKEWPFTKADALNTLIKLYFNNRSATYDPTDFINTFLPHKFNLNVQLSNFVLKLNDSLNSRDMLKAGVVYSLYLNQELNEQGKLDDIMNMLEDRLCLIKNDEFKEAFEKYPIQNLLKTMCMMHQKGILKKHKMDYAEIFKICHEIIRYIINHDAIRMPLDSVTAQKVVEAALVESLHLLFYSTLVKSNRDFYWIFMNMCKLVINTSNMKRPVAVSASFLREICQQIIHDKNEQDAAMLFNFLEDTLTSVLDGVDTRNSRIRCSLEYRLVIHSICLADRLPQKPLLNKAMQYLINVAKNSSSEQSQTCALHCIEMLLSDNAIRESTRKYVVDVVATCLDKFGTNSWNIRNASLQLWKTIVNCVLGQNSRTHGLRKSVEEFFQSYPQFISLFYRKMCSASNEDLIPLFIIFSEMHKANSLLTIKFEDVIQVFVKIFVDQSLSCESFSGLCAAEAFVSLSTPSHITSIFVDIIEYIKRNFCNLPKNILRNLTHILQLLYLKYKMYYSDKSILYILNSFGRFLYLYNSQYRYTLFPLLALTSDTLETTAKEIICCCQNGTYLKHRIWLSTNIPKVVSDISLQQLPSFLEIIFGADLPIALKVSCLNIIVKRFASNTDKVNNNIGEIIATLVRSLLKFQYNYNYIIMAFVLVIFLLYESSNTLYISDDFLQCVRECYSVISVNNCIYKMSVCVLVLSKVTNYNRNDRSFVSSAIKRYKQAANEDVEVASYAASTLIYLYRCCKNERDKYDVLVLAVTFLLYGEMDNDICKFTSVIFNKKRNLSVLQSLRVMLDFDNLLDCFGNAQMVYNFLIDITVMVCNFYSCSSSVYTFYSVENSSVDVPKDVIRNILLLGFCNFIKCKSLCRQCRKGNKT